MRKLIYVLLMALILSNAIIYAQQKIKFDVKTKFAEKHNLMIPKAGLIGCLKASNWAIIVETGEDYAIWLKNYKHQIKKNLLIFEIDVEIRRPSLYKEGKLIRSKHFKEKIDISETSKLKTVEDRFNYEKVKNQMNNANSNDIIIGLAIGLKIRFYLDEIFKIK